MSVTDSNTLIKDGFVATKTGRIHYLEAGAGEPLLLLHSNGCSAHEYEEVIAGLAKNRRVLAWDMPGHGDSDPTPRHLSIEDYSDAVIAFLDALDIKRASVAGSSVGGTICVDLGVRYADRFDWLFLVETPIRSLQDWLDGWAGIDINFGIPTQNFELIAPRFRKLTPAKLTRWNCDRNKAGAKTMVGVMWALRDYDVLENLGKIKGNAAVIYGDVGPTIAGASHFEKMLPDAPSITLEDCGHFPMSDDPAAFVDALESILK
ncbi:MAG: alpha/beta fold hydrolase [Alphaproteobacteria bacterium]